MSDHATIEALCNHMGGSHAFGDDNLAIALCTYLESFDETPDEEIDPSESWTPWVEEQCDAILAAAATSVIDAIRSNKIPGLALKAYDGSTIWLCDKCGKTRDGKGCRTCDANEIGRLRELVRSAYEEGYSEGMSDANSLPRNRTDWDSSESKRKLTP